MNSDRFLIVKLAISLSMPKTSCPWCLLTISVIHFTCKYSMQFKNFHTKIIPLAFREKFSWKLKWTTSFITRYFLNLARNLFIAILSFAICVHCISCRRRYMKTVFTQKHFLYSDHSFLEFVVPISREFSLYSSRHCTLRLCTNGNKTGSNDCFPCDSFTFLIFISFLEKFYSFNKIVAQQWLMKFEECYLQICLNYLKNIMM